MPSLGFVDLRVGTTSLCPAPPPLPDFSTPLLLLLSLGIIPPLQPCAQKREHTQSGVDAGELEEEEVNERKARERS